MIVWTMWFGEMPPYIKYCLDTIYKRCGYTVIVLTEENKDTYLKRCKVHPYVWTLERKAQIADCLRIYLLYEYGGIWVDADTIILKPLNKVMSMLDEKCFGFVTDPITQIPYNGYLVSKPLSASAGRWKSLMERALGKIVSLPDVYTKFHMFGSDIMDEVKRLDYADIPFDWFFPFNFSNGNGKIFYGESKITDHINDNTLAIALSNSWLSSQVGEDFKNSIEELMTRRNLFGSILRYSKELD